MIFKKLRERIATIEAVLDAVIELLHKRDILHRSEVQLEILARAGERLHMKRKFKLHEIPRNSKIYGFAVLGEDEDESVIIFNHIDGAYSHCHIEGKEDKVVHLSASTPLVKYKDGYKLDEGE